MELPLLAVPDCPNAAAFEGAARRRAGRPSRSGGPARVITGEQDAAQAGMHGSPTLLINGTGLFAARSAGELPPRLPAAGRAAGRRPPAARGQGRPAGRLPADRPGLVLNALGGGSPPGGGGDDR